MTPPRSIPQWDRPPGLSIRAQLGRLTMTLLEALEI
jgi:hypothetical protein